MNYAMLIKYIQKPWIDTKGIMEVAQCSRHSATKIRNEIEKRILDSGKILPQSSKKCVPTKMVLDLLNIDEDYVYKMCSKLERII